MHKAFGNSPQNKLISETRILYLCPLINALNFVSPTGNSSSAGSGSESNKRGKKRGRNDNATPRQYLEDLDAYTRKVEKLKAIWDMGNKTLKEIRDMERDTGIGHCPSCGFSGTFMDSPKRVEFALHLSIASFLSCAEFSLGVWQLVFLIVLGSFLAFGTSHCVCYLLAESPPDDDNKGGLSNNSRADIESNNEAPQESGNSDTTESSEDQAQQLPPPKKKKKDTKQDPFEDPFNKYGVLPQCLTPAFFVKITAYT